MATPALAQDGGKCAQTAASDLVSLADASISATEGEVVAASDIREHCRIRGYVGSTVGFEISMPTEGWNGKLVQAGCAGFCGRVMSWYCRDAVARSYACIVSDLGHRSASTNVARPSLSASWALANVRAQIDHGFRGVHITALAGKALVERYFGSAPRRSYFNGCSEGGREAMIAAQHFPWDFDGIIAGAPLLDVGRTFMSQLWNARMLEGSGAPLLTPETARRLSVAVLRQCDMNDGIADSVIGDPRRCSFDPRTIVCTSSDDGDCISAELADAITSVMRGPTTSGGEALTAGGLSSAVAWMRLATPGLAGRTVPESYGEEYFRYMGFDPAPGVRWHRSEFDFDHDYRRLGVSDAIMSATNPDLRRFRQAGGKLIMYHGWDDHLISPHSSVDYYETMQATMGGPMQTERFARLFMVPGMDHCASGNGAWAIDFLGYLDRWVEDGQAPDSIVGVRPNLPADPVQAFARFGRFPVPVEDVAFSRPVFPYPRTSRYRSGNGTLAESFQPVP